MYQFNVGSHLSSGGVADSSHAHAHGRSCPTLSSLRRAHAGYGRKVSACGLCHIPYSHRSPPFSMRLVLCNICGRKYVPDVLLATVELPHEAAVQGLGQLLEVHVCRVLPAERKGVELSAARVSELMPFIEYDLHRHIMSKLKVRSHNAIFGLRSQVVVSDGLLTSLTTGTSVLLGALPIPQPIVVSRADPGPVSGDAAASRDARKDAEARGMLLRLIHLAEENRKVLSRTS